MASVVRTLLQRTLQKMSSSLVCLIFSLLFVTSGFECFEIHKFNTTDNDCAFIVGHNGLERCKLTDSNDFSQTAVCNEEFVKVSDCHESTDTCLVCFNEDNNFLFLEKDIKSTIAVFPLSGNNHLHYFLNYLFRKNTETPRLISGSKL